MSYTYKHVAKNDKQRRSTLVLIGLPVLVGALLAVTHAYGLRHSSVPLRSSPTLAVSTHPPLPRANTNYGLPTRIQIPKLRVDAHVIYVGLTKDGNMSVPTNVVDAGWYKYGALPGNDGTAVIAGHLDGLRGEPGVFSDLTKLAAGDTITVTETNGLTLSFIVRETRSYLQNEQPAEVFTSASGVHLNLITCTGSWDSAEHRFAKRLVVFADKAP